MMANPYLKSHYIVTPVSVAERRKHKRRNEEREKSRAEQKKKKNSREKV